ncbi:MULTISPECIES: copper chaperone CopZ [Gracilibacillus]|uniref:copper chaperone CopZ n=1 Tax=Gracilibacillus TaxID=74385 RepID=UPI000824B726|nr:MULTISPECIES: copper chaperone CopZ [Gracilibacillus]
MQNITLKVQGMSCGHCVSSIEGNVGEMTGVESVKVHLEDGKVDVTFEAGQVNEQDIIEVIEDQGYDVA